MSVRAKFKFSRTEQHHHHYLVDGKPHNGVYQKLHFDPVYDDGIEENKRFAKATPSGHLEIQVDNPAAADFFKPGHHYYLDFTQAD